MATDFVQYVPGITASADIDEGVIVKVSAEGAVAPCAALTDIPVGVCVKEAKSGDPVEIAAVSSCVVKVKASAAIAVGGIVGTSATGTGLTPPAEGNVGIGVALEAATAAGQLIEVLCIGALRSHA